MLIDLWEVQLKVLKLHQYLLKVKLQLEFIGLVFYFVHFLPVTRLRFAAHYAKSFSYKLCHRILEEEKHIELLAETERFVSDLVLIGVKFLKTFGVSWGINLEVLRHSKFWVERSELLEPEFADYQKETRHTGHLSDQIKIGHELNLWNLSLLV